MQPWRGLRYRVRIARARCSGGRDRGAQRACACANMAQRGVPLACAERGRDAVEEGIRGGVWRACYNVFMFKSPLHYWAYVALRAAQQRCGEVGYTDGRTATLAFRH